jgi:hypothetical protein
MQQIVFQAQVCEKIACYAMGFVFIRKHQSFDCVLALQVHRFFFGRLFPSMISFEERTLCRCHTASKTWYQTCSCVLNERAAIFCWKSCSSRVKYLPGLAIYHELIPNVQRNKYRAVLIKSEARVLFIFYSKSSNCTWFANCLKFKLLIFDFHWKLYTLTASLNFLNRKSNSVSI